MLYGRKWIYLFICTLMIIIILFSGQVQSTEDMSSHSNTHMSILCAKLFDRDKGTPEQRLEM